MDTLKQEAPGPGRPRHFAELVEGCLGGDTALLVEGCGPGFHQHQGLSAAFRAPNRDGGAGPREGFTENRAPTPWCAANPQIRLQGGNAWPQDPDRGMPDVPGWRTRRWWNGPLPHWQAGLPGGIHRGRALFPLLHRGLHRKARRGGSQNPGGAGGYFGGRHPLCPHRPHAVFGELPNRRGLLRPVPVRQPGAADPLCGLHAGGVRPGHLHRPERLPPRADPHHPSVHHRQPGRARPFPFSWRP